MQRLSCSMTSVPLFLLATATVATGARPAADKQGRPISAVVSARIVQGQTIGRQSTDNSLQGAMQVSTIPAGRIIEFQ